MPDREKVIRAVDSCFDYWLDQHKYIQPSELETVLQRKADALALLKEDCHNCKLECLLKRYDKLKEKYDSLLKEHGDGLKHYDDGSTEV